MPTSQYLSIIMEELQQSVRLIAEEEAEKLLNTVLEANKVFTAGSGRSGLMAKSFSMRLMHMGIDAYVIGETATPNFKKDDLLIISSGSGETKTLLPLAQKARDIGGTTAAVTLSPDSSLGRLADFTVTLPGSPKDQTEGDGTTIQPMGSLYEQTLLLFYDAIILGIMDKKGLDSKNMYGRHANLE